MSKTIIQLGRYGDIINLLPLLWHDWQKTGEKQPLMVASEFSGLLDGVGYVDPVIYPGPYHELAIAAEMLEGMGREWVSTQVNGPVDIVRNFTYEPANQSTAVCTSFQKEMWKVAGRLKEWDLMYPLVFDRRDPEREALLLSRWIPKTKKRKPVRTILVSAGGTSSPFEQKDLLYELLHLKFKNDNLVDLSRVRAERIYDLLALYERAYCLVSTDTATLHLARACPELPVVALTNDKPLLWHGSSWMPNHIFYCRYTDFPKRVPEMLAAIEAAESVVPKEAPTIFHVWNDYESKKVLRAYPRGWIPTPVQLGACGRDSAINLKDEKRIPFLKDCLRMGMQRAREVDYICITRPDTCFMTDIISEELIRSEASFAYRLNQDKDGKITHFPVVDLFCAKKNVVARAPGQHPRPAPRH